MPRRYALSMLGLERQLAKRDDMLEMIGKRLPQIQSQVEHFGPAHENVVARELSDLPLPDEQNWNRLLNRT